MRKQILRQVKEALAKTLNLASIDSIAINAKLKEDLGLDSMSSLTFLIELEDSIPDFSVNPDTLEAKHLESVESVTDYIIQELGAERKVEEQ